MKKALLIILVCILFATMFVTGVYAEENLNVGDVIGESVKTDIVARINDYDIPSYNVKGLTYVVAEDLRDYGFKVDFDYEKKELRVVRNESADCVTNHYLKPHVYAYELGNKESDILYTDIVTYVGGKQVKGLNIGGKTLIPFDCLSEFAPVSYNDSIREISTYIPGILVNTPGFKSRTEGLYHILDEETKKAAKKFFSDEYYKYYAFVKKVEDEATLNFMGNHPFDKGIMMADLNDDKIPELFSVAWFENTVGCELIDGELSLASEEHNFKFIDGKTEKVTNKYMNDASFCGLYRHNVTGQRAIISYSDVIEKWDGTEYKEFKIITFDGEKFHTENITDKSIDEVTADYTEIENGIVSMYLYMDNMHAYEWVMDTALNFYRNFGTSYDETENGTENYFIKNFDSNAGELSLIPVRTVSYQEHNDAVYKYTSNGEVHLTDDGYVIKPYEHVMGYTCGTLYNNRREYSYMCPTEDEPGVVLKYMENKPVKATVPEGMTVRYPYSANGEEKIDAVEYFRNFSKYDHGNYYSVTLENGVVTDIECVYLP